MIYAQRCNQGKLCHICPYLSAFVDDDHQQLGEQGSDSFTWDMHYERAHEFQHRSYNLFTCNCHSFVANNLNRLRFNSGRWNVVNLAALIFLKGQWVSRVSMVRTFLPFVIITLLGLTFGGLTHLIFVAFFIFLLVGWFLLGTYCFKDWILL